MIKSTVSLFEKLCSRWNLLVTLYSRPYLRVVENEIRLAGITAADRVLNVGCGAVPFTAMLTARLTGAYVVAIDRDFEAARLAKNCVRRAGLSDSIDVFHCDGSQQAWVADGFDAAIVALQAAPKAGILSNLFHPTREPKRIVARVPSEPFSSQYDPLPEGTPIVARVAQNMKTFRSSALIVPRPSC